MQTEENDLRSKKSSRKENSSADDNRDSEMLDVDMMKNNAQKMKVYQGVLFIEGLKSVKQQSCLSQYFVTFDAFWNDCQEITNVSVNHIFNFLKVIYAIIRSLKN